MDAGVRLRAAGQGEELAKAFFLGSVGHMAVGEMPGDALQRIVRMETPGDARIGGGRAEAKVDGHPRLGILEVVPQRRGHEERVTRADGGGVRADEIEEGRALRPLKTIHEDAGEVSDRQQAMRRRGRHEHRALGAEDLYQQDVAEIAVVVQVRMVTAAATSSAATSSITIRSGNDTMSAMCGPTGTCRLNP